MKPQENDEFLRKRAIRQRKIKKRRLIITFCLLVSFLLLIGAVLCLTVFFPIKNLVIEGSQIYSQKELLKASGVKVGDNLFTVSAADIESSLKSQLPYVEKVELKRQFPDTLKIKVKDAYEFACYNVEGKYFIVSEKNWVLFESEEPLDKAFTVYGAKVKCSVGSSLVFENEKQKTNLDTIIKTCKENSVDLNEIDVSNEVLITLKVEGQYRVDLGTSNYIEEKIRQLATMLENAPKEQSNHINLSMWSESNRQGTFILGTE